MSEASSRDGGRAWAALQEAVGQAVVGQEGALRLLATTLLAGGHALIEDVPGTGKTLLARAFSAALGLQFARVQGTPDLLPSDVTGSSVLAAAAGTVPGDGLEGAFRFVPGPLFTNVLLVDEINRATPRTQSALLEAMQEGRVSVDGVTRQLPRPFVVLATQNPIELEGTFALPEAQLDRFLVRITVGYPSDDGERAIARRYRDMAEPLDRVLPVVEAREVLALQDRVRGIRVADEVERYLVAVVRATRDHPSLRLGASPRASVALYRASQAWALLAGREFVLPDDVVAVAPAVLPHRLLVDVDQELRGATATEIVAEVLAATPLPVGEGA
ncbi:MAG TPA: MoxR family ATPase [Candidatus Dormibacteraeota bacterium]|nr:MoxR family ATPase [Candidatus Dormibacteraeota bacterium]